MLVPTSCWLAKHKKDDRKRTRRTIAEEICSDPMNALSETRKQRADIENEYLRRLSREAHKK
jgi:hypothetical protein